MTMNNNIRNLIDELDSIKSLDDANQLRDLEVLAQQMSDSGTSNEGIDAFLRLYERFPTEDGFGIFWTILHGLEKLPDYEKHVINSILRKPSVFSVQMIGRLLNSRRTMIHGTNLLTLLADVLNDKDQPAVIRDEAQVTIQSYKSRT
jgi:hypothetical protein